MANYLYNGVELPELPKWDKTTYPYAVITCWERSNEPNFYRFYALPVAHAVDTYGIIAPTEQINLIKCNAAGGDAEWGALEDGYISTVGSTMPIIWANYDVFYENGSLYLFKSDPIPVTNYAIDSTSLFLGYLMGRQIAGQRMAQKIKYQLGQLCCTTIKFPKKYSHTSIWEAKVWNGGKIRGNMVWTDGTNFHYSNGSKQYILMTDIWKEKVWNTNCPQYANYIWTDYTNTYYLYHYTRYVLNNDDWQTMTWDGLDSVSAYGSNVWSDGISIYYSSSSAQYVLNRGIWELKTWEGFTNLTGSYIWSDGINVYHSNGNDQYVLNGNTWEPKTWNIDIADGNYIWSDGINVYYSNGDKQYVLNRGIWEPKTWEGLTEFDGLDIWSDGINVYYSDNSSDYVLV